MLNVTREFNTLLCIVTKEEKISETLTLKTGLTQIVRKDRKYQVKLVNASKEYMEVDVSLGSKILEKIFSKNYTSHS